MTESTLSCPRIDGARLWACLMALAEIGATAGGGVKRLALDDDDRRARDLFVRWCGDAGCAVRIDAVGNIFARRPGRDDGRPVVMTGSHLELVVWCNEEGTRFAPAMMGSMAYAGLLDPVQVLASRDSAGRRYGDELARIGYVGEGLGGDLIAAYFEAHIEQGPVLEARGATIGAVTGGQGQRWYDLRLSGSAAHAGSTPMAGRRDALVGAARVIEAARRIATAHGEGRATVGELQVGPNSRNVVPGEVRMTLDIRHPDDALRDAMDAQLQAAVREGLAQLDIVSGAAHDAVAIARIAPVGMIFVPCAGGISHNEAESATPADLAAGCQVLLRALLGACGHPAATAPRATSPSAQTCTP